MTQRSTYPDCKLEEVDVTTFICRDFEKRKDEVAFVDGLTGRELKYGELQGQVRLVGAGLTERGFKAKQVAAIFAPNFLEYFSIFHGICSIGGTATTANPAYTARELAHQLKDSGARFLFAFEVFKDTVLDSITKEGAKGVERIFWIGGVPETTIDGVTYEDFKAIFANDGSAFPASVSIDPKEDIAVLPYSSGTTGLQKGVMLTHYNLVSNMLQINAPGVHRFEKDDVAVGLLPFFHVYAQTVLMNYAPYFGTKVVVFPKFDPVPFLTAIAKYKITWLHLVPPLVLFLAKHPVVAKFDLSSVHTIVSGAAPLGHELAEECVKRLNIKEMRQGYGMTELSPVTHMTPRGGKKYGSAGVLIPNTEGKVVDTETGAVITEPHKTGELCVRGPQVMKGYLNNAEATAVTIDKDGFLHTGDVVYFDEEGYYFVVDRVKELIKYKGYQVAPAELESLLLTHPAIADCAVIPKDDEDGGEVPKAFVVRKPEAKATEDEIKEFIKEKVAHFKQLRGGVEFVAEIPKSTSGKILRRVLRDQERAKAAAEKLAASATATDDGKTAASATV